MVKDQPLLIEKEVNYNGEPLAVVCAESEAIARAACKLIEVEYKEGKPIFGITESRKRKRVSRHQLF